MKYKDLPSCPELTNECDNKVSDRLCIGSNNKIYKSEGTCVVSSTAVVDNPISKDGVYGFNNLEPINLGSQAINTKDNWILYHCKKGETSVICTKTYGYVKAASGNICSIRSGGINTCTTEFTTTCKNKYEVGTLYNTGKICLKENENEENIIGLDFGVDGSYLISIDNSKIFTSSYDKGAVVISFENAIILDTSKNGIDYCIDDNLSVWNCEVALCKGTFANDEEDCPEYWNCGRAMSSPGDFGICEKSDIIQNIFNQHELTIPGINNPDGYYLVKNNSLVTSANEIGGILYFCSNGTCTNMVTENEGRGVAPLGYLVNVGDSGLEPYIVCTSSTSCAIAIIGNSCVGEYSSGKATFSKLYRKNEEDNIKVCLYDSENNTEYFLEFNDENKKSYHIIGMEVDMFGIDASFGKYMVVNIDENLNLFVVDGTGNSGYYATSATNKDTTVLNTVVNSVNLYECNKEINGNGNHLECEKKSCW